MPTVPDEQIWDQTQREAAREAEGEPALAAYFDSCVLRHGSLEDSLSAILADKLEGPALTGTTLRELISAAMTEDPGIGVAVRADLQAVMTRDPACGGTSRPLWHFKGFHSIRAYRIARHYWVRDRRALAHFLQSRISEVFAVDIHPGARIGKGIMFDHATSVVIGETAHSFPALDMDQSLDETDLFDEVGTWHGVGSLR